MLAITPEKFHRPSFGIFYNNVKNNDGTIKYRGDTKICRDDLYFPGVVDYLANKYRNVPKVNVIMHACSNGEEVYSFLGVLIIRLKEHALKFLPISAKDIDLAHLKLAKKGIYNVTDGEYTTANIYMNGHFNDLFVPAPSKKSSDPHLKYTTAVEVTDSLKALVDFKQGNILKDASKINFKNTVLFARNFWPYLTSWEQEKLVEILSQKMDSTSTLIIGDYDQDKANIDLLLIKNGFKEKINNIFEKETSREKINNFKSTSNSFLFKKFFSNFNTLS